MSSFIESLSRACPIVKINPIIEVVKHAVIYHHLLVHYVYLYLNEILTCLIF